MRILARWPARWNAQMDETQNLGRLSGENAVLFKGGLRKKRGTTAALELRAPKRGHETGICLRELL